MRIVCLLFCFTITFYTVKAQQINFLGSSSELVHDFDLSEQLTDYTVFQLTPNELFDNTSTIHDFINISFSAADAYSFRFEMTDSEIISENYVLQLASSGIISGYTPQIRALKGQIKNKPDSDIRLTFTQDQLYGMILDGEHSYFIQPINDFVDNAKNDVYILYEENAILDTFPENWCMSQQVQQNTPHLGSSSNPPWNTSALVDCKEIEIALASDFAMFDHYGSISAVETRNIALINSVGTNYVGSFEFDYIFNIVEQFVSDCSSCDPWSSTTDPGDLLQSFRSWGNSAGGFSSSNDMASLQTKKDLVGNTVGIAYVGAVCTNWKYSVVEDWTSNNNFLRVTMAHEFGHNFNCSHDPDLSGTIMAPMVNNTTTWSSNSINSVNNYVNSVNCLSTISCGGGQAPVAGIISNVADICPGTTVHFYDDSEGETTEWDWTFNGGSPSASSLKNPVVTYNNPGIYNVALTVTNDFGSNDITLFGYISVSSNGTDVLFYDDFENGQTNFTIDNPDSGIGWEVFSGLHTQKGENVIGVDNFNYNNFSEKDHLISEEISLIGRENIVLQFDHAYARANNVFKDSLRINVSTDGGNSYPNTVLAITENGSQNFGTHPDLFNAAFLPSNDGDWCFGDPLVDCISIGLEDYTNHEDFVFRMTNATGNGNTMILDNIMLTSSCYDLSIPIASFTSDESEGCAPLEINFMEDVDGFVTLYEWEFPGGTPEFSNEPNPTVLYNFGGTFDVTLTVYNDAGSDEFVFPNYVIVEEVPIADGSIFIDGATIECFNNSNFATSYIWEFGDGNVSSDPDPVHTYQNDGIYTVSLLAISDCGQDVYSMEVIISSAPVAAFTANQMEGCEPFEVTFINQSSNNSLAFEWEFPGGTPSTSNETNPTVVYNTAGTFDVKLTAINTSGDDEIVMEDLISVMPLPMADFSFTTSDLMVQFTNTSQHAVSSLWDFGDNGTSILSNPSHTYAHDGTFTVTLITENDCGFDTATHQITVSTLPSANFSSSTTTGCIPYTLQFTDLSSSNATSWNWTFEGGTPSSSNLQHPSVTYNSVGSYDVSLEVSTPAGSDLIQKEDYITIMDVPNAGFSYTVDLLSVNFNNQSENADSYLWFFGDSGSSTEENPSYTYSDGGFYSVMLIASNQCGPDTSIIEVATAGLPMADFSMDSNTDCVPFEVQYTNLSQNAMNYNWSFEGGIPANSQDQNPLITYLERGVYGVTLEASNGTATNTLVQENVVIANDVPVASFDAEQNNATINFTNKSEFGSSYLWDFGDGTQTSEKDPTHTYAINGEYTITLIAVNDCGTDTSMVQISVSGATGNKQDHAPKGISIFSKSD